MKTIALIPARSGSKRVPDKNIRELKGKPLMAWSIEVAKACEGIDEVYVSTDDTNYGDIATDNMAFCLMRPDRISTDTAIDFDVINHAFDCTDFDLCIYLRPTTPFREVYVVERSIRLMQENPEIPSLRSVHQMKESAYKFFRIKGSILHPLSKKDLTDAPNQAVPATYRPNGYVDIVRRENVESGALWGESRYPFITKRTHEIDTEEDFKYAEYLARGELSSPFVFRGRGRVSTD